MTSRDRLLEAMGDLMWERGYSAASPRAVRERSGVGQGSMYHHFPTKHDLGVAALSRTCEETVAPSVEPLLGRGDPVGRLTEYLTRPRQALKGCRVGRMTQDPAVAADDELRAPVAEAFRGIHEALSQVIREAIDSGALCAHLDADRLACTISATIQGSYVLAMAQQDSEPFRKACAGMLDLLQVAGAPPSGQSDPARPSPVSQPSAVAPAKADSTTASTR